LFINRNKQQTKVIKTHANHTAEVISRNIEAWNNRVPHEILLRAACSSSLI